MANKTDAELLQSIMGTAPAESSPKEGNSEQEALIENEVQDEVEQDDGSEQDESSEQDDGADGADGVGQDDQGGEDEEGDGSGTDADDDDAEGGEAFEILDDDLIEVKVDGQVKEVSIADLKKTYSLATATEARLQEAAEARKAAQAERTTALERATAVQQAIVASVQQLETALVKPMVAPPDEKLRDKDARAYLAQVDAYKADQTRMETLRNSLGKLIQEQHGLRKEQLDEYRESQKPLLIEKMPELTDKVQGPIIAAKLQETAKAYGFSDAEIAAAMDHRYFLLVRDAMKWRDLQTGKKAEPVVPKEAKEKPRLGRRLSSGNTRVTASAKTVADKKSLEKLRQRARQTGKAQDIMPLLFEPAGAKRR